MPFKNEYVNSPSDEESKFVEIAKTTLRAGFSDLDCWVMDRDREMVLFKIGSGHDVDNFNCETWKFIDGSGIYYFNTEIIDSKVVSKETIAITRTIGFMRDRDFSQPSSETISHIREALSERKDLGMYSTYKYCEVTLIDRRKMCAD